MKVNAIWSLCAHYKQKVETFIHLRKCREWRRQHCVGWVCFFSAGWGKKCRVLAVTVSVRYCRHLGSFTPAPALLIRFPGLARVLVRAVRQLLSASLGWRWRILDQVSLWLLINMDKYTFLFLELNLQCSNIIRINQTPDSPVLSLYQTNLVQV